MSQTLVDDTIQPKAGTFATIPSDSEIAADLKAASSGTEENTTNTDDKGDGGYTLPEKFKDKSAEDIAQSYANLEVELGRKSQEVGTLRTLTDQLLELKPTVNTNQQVDSQNGLPELTADDVLNDPRSAIQGVAKEEVVGVNTRIDQLEAQLGLDAFEGRHPTFRADQADPDFQKFVQGSAYRQGLAQKAAVGNLESAEELWGAWDEAKPGEEDTNDKEQLTAKEEEALKTADSIANRGGGESALPGVKPISRHDLAKVKIDDEDRYYSESFQNYIQKMYAAKLVR